MASTLLLTNLYYLKRLVHLLKYRIKFLASLSGAIFVLLILIQVISLLVWLCFILFYFIFSLVYYILFYFIFHIFFGAWDFSRNSHLRSEDREGILVYRRRWLIKIIYLFSFRFFFFKVFFFRFYFIMLSLFLFYFRFYFWFLIRVWAKFPILPL